MFELYFLMFLFCYLEKRGASLYVCKVQDGRAESGPFAPFRISELREAGSPRRDVEQSSALSCIFACAWFFENSAGDVASARKEGKIRFQLHPLDRKFPLVATADIGKVSAETLTQSWTGIRHFEVARTEGYSPLDIARAFAEAVVRPVEAIAALRAESETLWVSQGMPEGQTAPRATICAFSIGREGF